jgi:hypothetical protein
MLFVLMVINQAENQVLNKNKLNKAMSLQMFHLEEHLKIKTRKKQNRGSFKRMRILVTETSCKISISIANLENQLLKSNKQRLLPKKRVKMQRLFRKLRQLECCLKAKLLLAKARHNQASLKLSL